MTPPPPIPAEYGSVTPRAAPATTAASTAFPPLRSTSSAALDASRSTVATAPPVPAAVGCLGVGAGRAGAGRATAPAGTASRRPSASSRTVRAATTRRCIRDSSSLGPLGGRALLPPRGMPESTGRCPLGGMEELGQLVDEHDRVAGAAPRSEIRARGLLHRGVAILCRNPAGEVYVHRRTTSKDVFPGLYDMWAGGM